VNTNNSYQGRRATNTFCVPDDDYDYDNEIIYDSVPAVTAVESSSESADSDSDSGSEDNSVMEISSPITSPAKCVDSVGSQHSPIELDGEKSEQPLATPRMTPPSAVDVPMITSHESRDGNSNITHKSPSGLVLVSEEFSVAESSDWEGDDDDQVDSGDEPMSESRSESEGDESDSDRVSVRLSPAPFLIAHQGQQATANCAEYDVSDGDSHMKEKERDVYVSELARHTADRIDLTLFNTNPSSLDERNSSWPVTAKNAADSDLPLQPSGKLFDHSLTGFHCDAFTQAMEDWPSHATHSPPYLLSDHRSPRIPYKDGPFVNSLPHLVESNSRTDAVVPMNSENEDARLHSTHVESSRKEAEVTTDMGQPSLPSTLLLEELREQELHNRASTNNIIDPSSSEAGATQRQRLKRKAMEAELDSPVQDICRSTEVSRPLNIKPAVEDESCLPDAQPQITVPELGAMSSQLTELGATHHPRKADGCTFPVPENGRPSKRVRTSEATNFSSHAATAVLGAVVGAVGTIAVLALLPAEYFS
jgi:hypothetical protein